MGSKVMGHRLDAIDSSFTERTHLGVQFDRFFLVLKSLLRTPKLNFTKNFKKIIFFLTTKFQSKYLAAFRIE